MSDEAGSSTPLFGPEQASKSEGRPRLDAGAHASRQEAGKARALRGRANLATPFARCIVVVDSSYLEAQSAGNTRSSPLAPSFNLE